MRKRALSLLACALAFVSVTAAEWVKPTPKLSAPSAFVPAEQKHDGAGATYYLWNEETKCFLTEGNDWGIRASISDEKGIELYFSKFAEGNYLFNTNTFGGGHKGWDYMWLHTDDENTLDVDWMNLDRPGYSKDESLNLLPFWNYEVNGNFIRIFSGSMQPVWNSEAQQGRVFYIGKPRTGDKAENTIVYGNCTTEDNVDWSVVVKADYETFLTQMAAYKAAVSLSKAIEASKAKYNGIDLSSVEAVYNNLNSTAEELAAAEQSIPAIEKEFVNNNGASVDNPLDATSFIKNPNYDEGSANWEGGFSTNDGVGSYWNAGNAPFDFWQTLTDLPNGVYQVQVYSAHRIGGSGNYGIHYQSGTLDPNYEYLRTCQIYANNYWVLDKDITSEMIQEDLGSAYWDKEIVNGYYIPVGTSYVTGAYNDLGMFNNSLFCTVTDGTLKIGIRCQDRMDGSWTSFDTWRLTYYGNAADAIEMLKTNLSSNLKDYTEELVQASLKEAYGEAVEAFNAATTVEDIEAAYAKATSLYYDLESSKNAYAHFLEVVTDVEKNLEGLQGESAEALTDFINDLDSYLEEAAWSVEELKEKEEWMHKTLDAAIKETPEEGQDFTELIKDNNCSIRDFGKSGWEGEVEAEAVRMGEEGKIYQVAEIWNYSKFDFHQTLTGMPKGIYEVVFPALYRAGDKDYSHPAKAEIYLNDLACDVAKASEAGIEYNSIMDHHDNWTEIDGYNCYNFGSEHNDGPWPYDQMFEAEDGLRYCPSSVFGASVAFNGGRYQNKVYGIVGEDGVLTFGMRSKNNEKRSQDWLTFGHITMRYMGGMEEGLAGLKEEVIQQAQNYIESESKFYQGYKDELATKLGAILDADDQASIIAAIKDIKQTYQSISESMALYEKMNEVVSNDESGLYAVAIRAIENGTLPEAEAVALMNRADEIMIIYAAGTANNEIAQAIIDEVLSNKLVDVIYIMGGFVGFDGDAWAWDENGAPAVFAHPMYKNAEGKYVGTADFRNELYGSLHNYAGNRSLIGFRYMGKSIGSANNQTRWLTNSAEARGIKMDNGDWFLCPGGEWEFTIDLEAMTVSCKPLTPYIYKNQIYAVGNLLDNNWARDYSTASHWELQHQGGGIYKGSIAFNKGVSRGEVTLFSSDMWLTDNWGEGRIGNPEDQLAVESGQETLANRFEGDRKWILDQNHKYIATYDMNKGTVRFDINDLEGDDTEESPLLINDYDDLLMMRAYLRNNETHYFALTDDIYLGEMGTFSQLNSEGSARWINLDGRNHAIIGFKGDKGLQSHKDNSFFGILGGAVKNLGFTKADVKDDGYLISNYVDGLEAAPATSIIAGILGSEKYNGTTTLENVFVMGNIEGGNDNAAALAGVVEGTVAMKNVYAQANILSMAANTAGLVGNVKGNLTIENAYYAGETAGAAIIKNVEEGATATLTNIANFTTNEAGCTPANYLAFDGSNFAALQQGVVAFDNTVWGCSMKEGEYPVLKAFQSVIDGVNNVTIAGANNGRVFDLSGRQVSKAQKGLYILNNKKVVVK